MAEALSTDLRDNFVEVVDGGVSRRQAAACAARLKRLTSDCIWTVTVHASSKAEPRKIVAAPDTAGAQRRSAGSASAVSDHPEFAALLRVAQKMAPRHDVDKWAHRRMVDRAVARFVRGKIHRS